MRISFLKIFFTCVMLASGTYGVLALRNSHAIASFDQKQRQISQLEEENTALAREIETRKHHLDDIQQNPEHLKLEIEDRLKVMPPGAKEFIVQDGVKTPAAKPRP